LLLFKEDPGYGYSFYQTAPTGIRELAGGGDSTCAPRRRLVYYPSVAHMVELADTLL
jgi:hypothetical protein